MAIKVYGNVKNGIQLKYGDANSNSVTRTINGANMADAITETNNPVIDNTGYTIAAAYGFGQAVKTLVGASSMAISLIQTRQIDDVA